jgi:hypothetical protein
VKGGFYSIIEEIRGIRKQHNIAAQYSRYGNNKKLRPGMQVSQELKDDSWNKEAVFDDLSFVGFKVRFS